MKKKYLSYTLFIVTFSALFFGMHINGSGRGITDPELDVFREVNEFVNENEACFKCHGEPLFELPNDIDERVLHRHMCPDYIFEREEYYNGNHKSFACFDCHSSEYEVFPHPLEPRLENNGVAWIAMDLMKTMHNTSLKRSRRNTCRAFTTSRLINSAAGNAIHIPIV